MSTAPASPSGGNTSTAPATPSSGNTSYFRFAVVLFILFNIVISPIQNWLDMLMGYALNDNKLFWHPFDSGNFFFYSIVLCSDAIFRSAQHVHDRLAGPARSKDTPDQLVPMLLVSGVIVLLFSVLLYSSFKLAVAIGAAQVLPANFQLVCTGFALFISYMVHRCTAPR